MIRLRELRKEKGWTLKDLASMLDVSESSISLYERGINEPDTSTLIQIADIFGVSIDSLLDRLPPDDNQHLSDLAVRFALSNGDEPISPEQYAEVKNYARYLQERDAIDNG